MKIVKRDGRTVEYNPEKIKVAIMKANKEVSIEDRISEEDVNSIIIYIESLNRKRMLVEDIQDIIEKKLMEHGKYNLAKTYIIYRYVRSVIRKSNTTDASILALLKNNSHCNAKYLVANRQRDIMAGEASKDLAYRLLLPQNVVKAEKENIIKFCNVEYFTEPIIENSKIRLDDMLENGTVINDIKIESPKGFQAAANILIEIIASVASCQTGNIYVELKDLFKYYYLTYEKLYTMYKSLMKNSLSNEQIRALARTQSFVEVKSGIQTIFYQINTLSLGNGLVPKVHFLINLDDLQSEAEENIVFEFIRQKVEGIPNVQGKHVVRTYPVIVLAVDNNNIDNYQHIFDELNSINSEFIVMNTKQYKDFYEKVTKFNQGSIILNIAKIALESKNNSADFMEMLEQNLDICYEGFLCRNHNLQGVFSNKSPIHWQYGSISRLDDMERIDLLLKSDSSYMIFVLIGFEAALKILGADSVLKIKIKKLIEDYINRWNTVSNFEIIFSNYYNETTVNEIYLSDVKNLEKYNISSYFDSKEFIQKDYFADGLIYLITKDCSFPIEEFIIKKSS